MIYIINNKVLFNHNDCTLSSTLDSENFIKLQPITCLVFLEFLNNTSQKISRDELLENVWVGRGYTPSNASLNNSIVSIRKSYQVLTGDELHLVTVPKFGYEFFCDVIKMPDEVDSSATSSDILRPRDVPPNDGLLNKRYVFLLSFILLTGVVFFYAVFFASKPIGYSMKNIHKIMTHGSCTIFVYNESSKSRTNAKDFDNLLNDINCSDESELHSIFIDMNTQNDKYKFYTACTRDGSKPFSHCINHKTLISSKALIK